MHSSTFQHRMQTQLPWAVSKGILLNSNCTFWLLVLPGVLQLNVPHSLLEEELSCHGSKNPLGLGEMSLAKYSAPVFDLPRVMHSKCSSRRQRRGIGLQQIAACCTLQLSNRTSCKELYYCHCINVIAGNKQQGNYKHSKVNKLRNILWRSKEL